MDARARESREIFPMVIERGWSVFRWGGVRSVVFGKSFDKVYGLIILWRI